MSRLRIVLFIFLYSLISIDSQLEYTSPSDCVRTLFFDILTLSCKKCPNNLIPSENGLRCICNGNSRPVPHAVEATCELCSERSVLTSDKTACIPCDEHRGCECLENDLQLERDFNGTLLPNLVCHQCPKGTFASIDKRKCLPCSITTVADYETFATISNQRIQKFCLPENMTSLINSTIQNTFLSVELPFAFHFCKESNAACKHLENLCSLTLRRNSTSCQLLDPSRLAHVFYGINDTKKILEHPLIPVTYTLSANKINSKLHFVAAKYSLRGKLLSIADWDPPCPGFESVRFGVNVNRSCEIAAEDLFNMKMEFSTLHLSYSKNDEQTRLLYELPILVKTRETDMDDTSQWQLMRNYCTADTISSGFEISNSTKSAQQILRYIKSLTIQIKPQGQHAPGRIYPPLVIVEYEEIAENAISSNTKLLLEYKIIFKLPENEMGKAIEIAMGVSVGVAVIYAALQAWSYSKKNAINLLNVPTGFWFVIYCFGAIGNALLLVSASSCIYFFILYKGQTVLHVLLPDEHNEKVIKVSTMLAFVGKVVEIVSILYYQHGIQIFLIDWEQPRKDTPSAVTYDSPHTSLKKTYKHRFRRQSSQMASNLSGNVQSEISSKSTQPSPSMSRDCHQPLESTTSELIFSLDGNDGTVSNRTISIWRTYFIANEWLRIRTKRKTNILLQVFTTLFGLEIIGLKVWAAEVPEWSLDQHVIEKENFMLKYAVGVAIYTIVYSSQWIFSTLYEKYMKNSLQEFVDLCSVANISIFILSHGYRGHYIHGRSVHGFADTDLLNLISDLTREENHLCAHRGLIPGTTEQTFVISVSKSFRSIYDALLDPRNMSTKRFSGRNLSDLGIWEERWKIHLKIRKFLCSFLDHCYQNVNYTVKERRFVEKLCDIEIDRSTEESTFYIDRHHSFGDTMFYGYEWALATFELATFTFVLMLNSNYVSAAIITILLSKAVILVVQYDKNKNLAKKTLIDKRFLM